MASQAARRRTLRRMVGAGLVLCFGALVHVFAARAGTVNSIHALGVDDAYISFRYAENLASGHGLVFNPGERVEGYSNFLFVLMAAGLSTAVDRASLYTAVALLNVLALLVAYAIFCAHARRLSRQCGRSACNALA